MRNWFRIDQDDGGSPTPKNRARIWATTILLQHTSLDELQHLGHENNNLYGHSGTCDSGTFASEQHFSPPILFLKISFFQHYYQLSSFYFTVLNLEHKTSLIGMDIFGNFKILVWDFYSCLGLLSFHQAGLTDKFLSKGSLLAVKTCFRNSSKVRNLFRLEVSLLGV